MLTVQLSVPELKAHAQAIREMAQDPMTTLQTLAGDLRPRFEGWLNDLMKAELALHLGREPYERKASSKNHRNGYRSRRVTVKGLGTLELRVPRDREGGFRSGVVPERIQVDPRIEQDLQMLFLGAASTRTVELMSERLNKEFKRRTKPMEIVAGENAVYTILAFVAMKMEMSWRNAPFRNSGFRKLKPFAGYFTHGS